MTLKKTNRVTAKFNLKIVDDVLPMEATVPDARINALEMIPVFQNLTNQTVAYSIDLTERKGKKISCKAGCGACCKQPVPVTLLEAEYLNRLIMNMPEKQQQKVRAGFAHTIKTVTEAGLLEDLENISDLATEQKRRLAKEYFELGLECPFLENQSCGIYQHRPLQCREFLVTSDPRFCAELDPEGIEHVEQPISMASALRQLSLDSSNNKKGRGWILMIFAMKLAKPGRSRLRRKWGKEWLEGFLSYAIGK